MSTLPASPSLDDNPRVCDWIVFRDDGRVTLKTGKVEIGQGVLTALVQIAADELDIAPERFDVISGDTRRGPTEGATSSSLSMEVTGRAVRQAASAARHRQLAEAGQLLQADAAALSVEDGTVCIEGRETPLTLWGIAGSLGTLDERVCEWARPKAVPERRLVGTSLARIDLAAKVHQSPFIHDIQRVGMRHGRVLHPPAHGRTLVSFDEAALRGFAPGVKIVRDGDFLGLVADSEAAVVRAVERAKRLVSWSEADGTPPGILEALGSLNGEASVVLETGDVDGRAGRCGGRGAGERPPGLAGGASIR